MATLAHEPDGAAGGFALGPRTLLRTEDLKDSGLLSPGTLFSTKYRLDLPAGADLPASSVYRALEALSGVGVVQHIHLGHGATAYHLTDGDDAHVHLQCRSCGAVLDLPAEILDPVAAYVARAGFELDPTHTALSGSCAACR